MNKKYLALINAKSFEEVITFAKQIKKHIVITRGANGSMAINGEKIFECPAKSNLKLLT